MEIQFSYVLKILYLLNNILQVFSSYSTLFWDNHVYTGSHLDDFVTATREGPPKVIIPTLLVLYSPQCENNLRFLKNEILPPYHLMVLAKHDYERFPNWIWYRLDERDNLARRYKPLKTCPEFLFFKNGSSLLKPERHVEGVDKNILSWIYDRIRVGFKIVNRRPRPIKVHFDTTIQKTQQSVSINPGEVKDIECYISNIVYISDGNKFVYARVVDSAIPDVIQVLNDKTDIDIVRWLRTAKLDMNKESAKARNWRHDISMLYLLNFKQPVLLPRFTRIGYKKEKIPKELYDKLYQFYVEHEKDRQPEENSVEPAINDSEVKCGMVVVDEDNLGLIDVYMRPLLEEWANCTLEPTRTYGIREYYTGNILRNHVDRISTHVVSVIFQISKKLNQKRDWALEIIDYRGLKKQVYLEPGEMLYYESATLIHGRPKPFEGDVFANVFIHYKPVKNWDWDVDYGSILKNKRKLDTANAMTPIYESYPKSKMYHDEL